MKEEKKLAFDCHYNNRMPEYVPKKLPPSKIRHCEIVDGVRVWIDGPKLNPYKGVDANSLSLKSRIDTGTFETHEGKPRSLDKAQGSDLLQKQIELAEQQYNKRKHDFEECQSRERLRKAAEQYINPENKDK